jgi:hypothetical protein
VPNKPFWLPDTQGFLATAIILLIAVVVLILILHPPVIDERTSGVLMTIVGVLIACLKDVYSFFFGSSKGSEKKDDALISASISPGAPSAPTSVPAGGVATAVKAMIVALAVGLTAMVLLPQEAMAQGGIKVRFPDPLKLNQQQATNDGAPSGLAKFMNDLAALKTEVVDGAVADLNAADADASTLTNASDPTSFRDPIAHACYPAAAKFLQSLPTASPPTGTFVLVQLFQKKRDFVMQIQAGLPTYLKLGCAPLLGDEAAIFTKVLGLVGVKVALSSLIPGAGTLAGLSF